MRAADEVMVVADSTKFGHTSLAHLCPLEAIDVLVVDDGLNKTWREKIKAAGVRLIVADKLTSAPHTDNNLTAATRTT